MEGGREGGKQRLMDEVGDNKLSHPRVRPVRCPLNPKRTCQPNVRLLVHEPIMHCLEILRRQQGSVKKLGSLLERILCRKLGCKTPKLKRVRQLHRKRHANTHVRYVNQSELKTTWPERDEKKRTHRL